jgi:hypothetical protein
MCGDLLVGAQGIQRFSSMNSMNSTPAASKARRTADIDGCFIQRLPDSDTCHRRAARRRARGASRSGKTVDRRGGRGRRERSVSPFRSLLLCRVEIL